VVDGDVSRGSAALRILLLADSLSFQGPQGIVAPKDPRLYPQVLAHHLTSRLSLPVEIGTSAREGWTAREAWWAVTKDPWVYGTWLAKADVCVLGVGGMDQLPAIVPTYIRDSLPYIRSGAVRRRVRKLYREWSPRGIAVTGGLMRQLPPAATERYFTRIIQAVRLIRGDIPIVAITPSPYGGRAYPSQKFHASARQSMLTWGRVHGVGVVDIEQIVLAARASGDSNPDGLHWGWSTHQAVGTALADEVMRLGSLTPSE